MKRNARYAVIGERQEAVYIVDLFNPADPTLTITNDAERVAAEVAKQHPGKQIVYQDTDGDWDELKQENGEFSGFGSWAGWTP